MTGWTLFFIVIGIAFFTYQFFRLIELIERPAHRARTEEKNLPAAWNVRLWDALDEQQWTSSKS